jgi:superfamily II DNA and RNA helicase
LYTAAHNYHTTYLNQLLIHAQRPDAAACASMEYWNTKANRLVMRGSRSITVLQRRQGVAATKPVFAIDDTILLSQTHTGGPWEVTNTTRLLLLQGKSDDWLTALAQEGVSNDADRARRMLERNVADSTLQWAQPDEQMQLLQALVTQSAVYIARLRIGLPVQDEDYPAFQSVSQFDTCQISLCLGGYLQAAAEPMLNAIGREALRLNRDSIAIPYEPVHNESTPTQLNSREETVTHDLHEEPRGLPDSEPFPAEPAEPVSEPLREAASGISGTERADALRPADAGGHAADELQPNRKSRAADGGQDSARADADHPDAGPQDEPAGLGKADQQPEEAGGGSSPFDAVRSLTEAPAKAESEQSPSAFALPEFPPTLLPQLLASETSSRASNAEYLTFYNKNPLLIDRLRFVRESYKDIFTELLLADDTRVGFHRQDNGLLVWQGAYLTRSAETLLPWRAVANALNDLIEQHELIAAIDPKKLPQVEEQLSFELPDGSPPSAENNRLEKDDFLTPEKQETVIRSTLPVAEYNAPQMDDGSVITDEEVNLALAAGSNFENSKFRIYQQLTTTQGDHAAFLKKEYGSGGRSWDYQSGAHGWVDHGPAGLKLILTNEEGRFERRLPWRAAAKRIAYLIEMQRFLTPQELEQYPAWAAEQREPASAVRDEPSTIPESRPICAEGSVVYLEDDHRFTVERIGQFDVHLRDEEVPLFGCAISREEFQRQLDANPRNGGMMLSEQQRTALVQTQTEQALSYIEDYLKDEFEITEPDFSDLTRIDLGYTTTEDEKHVIQVYADLEHCTVTKLVDDTLQSEGVKIRVKKQSGQLLYKAADLDGTWIPADALGDGFTLAGLESAIKNKSGILDTNHSTSIAELYQELTTNYPQSCDTSVRLTSRQICSASKRGVLLQIHDSSGNPAKLMIDNSHIHTTPDGSVSADIGAAFSYDITYDDGTHGTIRGTDLIRQIDEENLTQPLIVSLTADQIMAMSLRGVTVHLPQYHIERLFIPERYVQRNVEQGSCAISLYPGWQYSYVPIGSEKTRKSISGTELAQSLGGVVQVSTSESSLARRVANVERRAGIANAQELGKLLGSMADNGLHSAADFDKQISAYQREEMKLRNEIAELRSKSKIYAATAHNLQACHTYKSVWLEYASKPLAQKDTFYKQNEAALQAYSRAASQLDKMGISLSTEPEKVRQLVTETESRIADLIAELETVRKSNRSIQEDKEKVEQIQSG